MTFQDWFDVAGYSILIIIIGFLSYRLVRLRISTKNIANLYLETASDYELLKRAYEALNEEKMAMETEKSDGFVKFLSDSRDWAFEYIENVQGSLHDFDEKVRPVLDWAMTYGMANGENAHTRSIEKISEAYEELKRILPKNEETPNN